MTCARALAALALVLHGCSETKVVAGFPPSYAGIGVELRMVDDRPQVVRAMPGGPADEAGITKNDRILFINGVTTRALGLGDVVVRLRGKPGSQVTMTLERDGQRFLAVVRRRGLRKGKSGYRLKER